MRSTVALSASGLPGYRVSRRPSAVRACRLSPRRLASIASAKRSLMVWSLGPWAEGAWDGAAPSACGSGPVVGNTDDPGEIGAVDEAGQGAVHSCPAATRSSWSTERAETTPSKTDNLVVR